MNRNDKMYWVLVISIFYLVPACTFGALFFTMGFEQMCVDAPSTLRFFAFCITTSYALAFIVAGWIPIYVTGWIIKYLFFRKPPEKN